MHRKLTVLRALACSTSAVAAMLIAAPQALAQSTPPPESAESPDGIAEIIVTARKREEGLQDTPISISAFSAETLEARGTVRVDEIAAFTPNLQLFNSPGFGGTSASSAIYIRGVGQKDFSPFTEPGVGVYIDGVYVARSVGGIFDLVDVERIEVLRGPQGTLFGRNTIGGAVSITSKKPQLGEWSGKMSGSYGTDNKVNLKGAINIPLGERVAMNASLSYSKQDGYVTRTDGIDLGNTNKLSWRGAIRFEPSDNLEINIFTDGQRVRENGPAFQLIGVNFNSQIFNPRGQSLGGVAGGPRPTRLAPVDVNAPGYLINLPDTVGAQVGARRSYANPAVTVLPSGQVVYSSATGNAPVDNFSLLHNYLQTAQFLGSGGAVGAQCFSGFGQAYNPQAGTAASCYGNQWVRNDGTNAGTSPAYSRDNIWGVGGTIDLEISDNLSAKSITAYRDLGSSSARDGDHSPNRVIAYVDDPYNQWQISQEFQLQGESFNNRFNWIIGAYYFKEKGINLNEVDFTPIRFETGGRFENTSLAIFAQGTFELTDQLSVTPGLRWTRDRKKFFVDGRGILENKVSIGDPSTQTGVVDCGAVTGNSALNGLTCFTGMVSSYAVGTRVLRGDATTSYKDLTPMLNVSYKWTPDLMMYLNYSEGFKGGGFTHRTLPLPQLPGDTPTFEPETVRVYEVGFKYSGVDRRFQLNGAFFYTDYKNLQIQVLEGAAPQIKNVGSARIMGLELEAKLAPAEGWLIEGGLGLLDDKYKEFDAGITAGFRDPLQLSDQFEQVSRVTANIGVQKQFQLGGLGSLTPRADWSYRSKTYFDAINTEVIAQQAYSQFNANLAWASEDGRFSLVFSVANLGDKKYLQSATYNETFGIYEGVYARGREWSGTLRAGF
ncbi:MAG: TonB-dependent receptor [Sphingomonadaceae bacterium]|nr:TonB-dependent receptor [Sphingomonadaceae bacterium]